MDNNIFPKIWKVIKFGYTIIATINVQIQTKDCVDSNVLLMRLLQKPLNISDISETKASLNWNFRMWIGVFTILQLLNDPVHVLIKSNKPSMWSISIRSIYLKIFVSFGWLKSFNEFNDGYFRCFKNEQMRAVLRLCITLV